MDHIVVTNQESCRRKFYDGMPEPEWYRARIEREEDLDDLRECLRKESTRQKKWPILTVFCLLVTIAVYLFVRK